MNINEPPEGSAAKITPRVHEVSWAIGELSLPHKVGLDGYFLLNGYILTRAMALLKSFNHSRYHFPLL